MQMLEPITFSNLLGGRAHRSILRQEQAAGLWQPSAALRFLKARLPNVRQNDLRRVIAQSISITIGVFYQAWNED
jgi:hypothetical protein